MCVNVNPNQQKFIIMNMKTKIIFKGLVANLLMTVFLLSSCSESISQKKELTDLKDFKIVVEKTEDGIRMQSLEGSAWIDLSFNLKDDKPQAIDEYGMTDLDKVSDEKDANLADFLFTITKTESVIILKGIEGTVWTDLSFSLTDDGKQAFDQFGMAELD